MVTVEEGLKIAEELFEILSATETGIGLAANQMGIDARVAVVNVIEPRILINPLVVEYSNPFLCTVYSADDCTILDYASRKPP